MARVDCKREEQDRDIIQLVSKTYSARCVGTGDSGDMVCGLLGWEGNALSFMPAPRHLSNLQAGQWRLWALLTSQLPAKRQVSPAPLLTVHLWETAALT